MTRWALERLSDPELEPITKSELKVHLRIPANRTSEDDWLDDLIKMARESVEETTGRVLVDSRWRLTLFGNGYEWRDLNTITPARPLWTGDWVWGLNQEIQLRRSPVIALTSFVTVDSAGTETAVSASTYALREPDSKWPRIAALSGATWNEWLNYDMRIVYRAGYVDRTGSPTETATAIPARYKAAMKLLCEAHYDRDEKQMKDLIDCAERLLRRDHCELSMA